MWADGAGPAWHPRRRCLGDHGRGAAPCDQARTATGPRRVAPGAAGGGGDEGGVRRPLRDGHHRSGGHRVGAVGEGTAQAVLVEMAGEGHALSVGAPHRPQCHHLLGPVYALGDGLEAEVRGDPQDTCGDLVLAGRLDDPLDQAPVEFEYVHREPPQGVGGRVAAAEPVQGDPDAEPAAAR